MIRYSSNVIGALIALVAPAAATGADLQPKPKPGAQVHYRVNLRSDQTWKIETAPDQPPREVKQASESEVGMGLTCSRVHADGSVVFTWTLLYVAMSTEGYSSMEFDSRDPAQADSPAAYLFEQIINQPATVTVDAAGEVLDYQDPPTLGGGPIREQMASFFGKDAFESLGLFLTRGAPADASEGSTWSYSRSRDLPQGSGKIRVSSDCKLEALEDDGKTARVTVRGTLAMEQPESAGEGGPALPPSMVIDKGGFTGNGRWDCVAGQVISNEFTTALTGTISGAFSAGIEHTTAGKLNRATTEEFFPAPKPAAPLAPSD